MPTAYALHHADGDGDTQGAQPLTATRFSVTQAPPLKMMGGVLARTFAISWGRAITKRQAVCMSAKPTRGGPRRWLWLERREARGDKAAKMKVMASSKIAPLGLRYSVANPPSDSPTANITDHVSPSSACEAKARGRPATESQRRQSSPPRTNRHGQKAPPARATLRRLRSPPHTQSERRAPR